jgi:hypothetical protein
MSKTEKLLTAAIVLLGLGLVGSMWMTSQALNRHDRAPAVADRIAEDCKAYLAALTQSCEDAAKRIEDGDLKTVNQVVDAVKTGREASREALVADQDDGLKRCSDATGNITDRAGAGAIMRKVAKGLAGK